MAVHLDSWVLYSIRGMFFPHLHNIFCFFISSAIAESTCMSVYMNSYKHEGHLILGFGSGLADGC